MDSAEELLGSLRRLVPEYDGMVEAIIAVLKTEYPKTILDIGSGVGNVDMLILDKTPISAIDCVEISSEMARASVSNLSRHLDRAKVIVKDAMDFDPCQKYDAILSNLAIRSMEPEKKEELLSKIRSWLKPGGVFIWGDMIRHDEAGRRRKVLGLKIRLPFKKKAGKIENETPVNYPLTEAETIGLAGKAGFSDIREVWKRGSFAVFRLKV